MTDWNKLGAIHLDVLKEIGNIGVGNAATSLAQMLNDKINMEVPRAAIGEMGQLINMIGHEEELVTCISLEVEGEVPSNVFFVLKQKCALSLVDKLMGFEPGTSKEIDEIAESALQELGNILTGSILNAMSSMTNLNLRPTVPAFAYDMLGAVVSSAMLERGYFDEKLVIIETRFFDENVFIDGYFFMLPRLGALDKLFASVGINL